MNLYEQLEKVGRDEVFYFLSIAEIRAINIVDVFFFL